MKNLYTILIAILLVATARAQSPEKMSYQAVIRNSSDQLVTNQSIGMQISILQGGATGTAVYVERHFPTTNGNGLVSLEIGTGVVVSGNFTTIDWVNGLYFVKTETDLNGGATYTIAGTSQLLSVPYALHSKTADSVIDGIVDTVTVSAGDGITVEGTYPNFTVVKTPYKGAIYRWATFSSYNQAQGWYAGNNGDLFGGVNPSNWGDANGMAYQMSSDKDVLLTLFTRKGYAGKNAMVYANEWSSYSSTNSKHAVALFRIKNVTKKTISWNVSWRATSYASWGERASVALNGVNSWDSGSSNYYTNIIHTLTLSIPANRTSTVIFVAASTSTTGDMRGLLLAFQDDCLDLPPGLIFVDDLDTAPNGWDN